MHPVPLIVSTERAPRPVIALLQKMRHDSSLRAKDALQYRLSGASAGCRSCTFGIERERLPPMIKGTHCRGIMAQRLSAPFAGAAGTAA